MHTYMYAYIYVYICIYTYIHKTTIDSNNIKNYHPIYNMSFLLKLIERFIANRLQSHLSSNGPRPMSEHLIKLRQTPVLLPKRNSFDNNTRQPITMHDSFLYEAY